MSRWLALLLTQIVCAAAGPLDVRGQEQITNLFELLPDSPKPSGVESSSNLKPTENQNAIGSSEPAAKASSSIQGSKSVSEEQVADPSVPAGGDRSADDQPEDPLPKAKADGENSRLPAAEVALEDELAPKEMDGAEVPDDFRPQPADPVLAERFTKALIIDASGPIFGRFHWYLNQRLDAAKRDGVDLIIVRITTPGGYVDESIQLGRRLRDIDWATTIAFVPEETISGGAIIALGTDRIYMRPEALIGDAGPVRMGMGGQFEHAEEKVVSYLAEAIRGLSESQGRPGALAEAMVDRNLKVYEAVDLVSGNRVFITQVEKDNDPNGNQFRVLGPVPETGENRFLTLQGKRALELGICEGVFDSEDAMLAALTIEQLRQTESTWVDSTVYILNLPVVTAILLVLGMIGLYLELAAPGISVAGLSSLLCFGLFFWSHALGGTSGWLEAMLFMLGIVCVVCELFVLPGFGVFGISGIALIVLSLVMASQDFVLPEEPAEWKLFQRNLLLVLGVVLGVIVVFVAHVLFLDSLPGLNRLKLSAPESSTSTGASPALTGLTHSEAEQGVVVAVGRHAIADSDLRPSGKVLIDGRLLDVITEGDYVDEGTPVEILRIEGNRVIVRARKLGS